MTRLDWRYRLAARSAIVNPDHTRMTEADRVRARDQRPPRLLTGRPHRKASTSYVDEPSAGTRVRIRIDRPPPGRSGLRPLAVYIHGGGWMSCDMNTPAWLTTRLAVATGGIVASVDYRLAPEHPFPAALDDCWTALTWIVEHASTLGVDADRVVVMGDSAGGNLSAVLCLMARDRDGPSIRHQTLIYPALDLTLSSPSIEAEAHHGVLDRSQLEVVYRAYLGAGEATDWRVSPLHADDLGGLPPAHILVAGHDTLRDDGIRYSERLRARGVPVRLDNYEAMPHGFLALSLSPNVRRRALAGMVRELGTAFSAR